MFSPDAMLQLPAAAIVSCHRKMLCIVFQWSAEVAS